MCLRLLWTPGPLCPSLSAEKNESLDATVRWVSHSVYISIKPDILIFLSWKSDFSFFTSFASASSKDPVFTKTWLGIHTTWSRIWRKSREILWKYNYVQTCDPISSTEGAVKGSTEIFPGRGGVITEYIAWKYDITRPLKIALKIVRTNRIMFCT